MLPAPAWPVIATEPEIAATVEPVVTHAPLLHASVDAQLADAVHEVTHCAFGAHASFAPQSAATRHSGSCAVGSTQLLPTHSWPVGQSRVWTQAAAQRPFTHDCEDGHSEFRLHWSGAS